MAACDCSPLLQRPAGAVVSVDVCLGAGGGGRRLSFRASERAGVAALKSALAARVGVPANRLLLLHRNRVLSDSGTLADHRVGDGCELKLLPRLSTGRECGCNASDTQNSKVCQTDAASEHLLDAVNNLHPDEVDRFIQGRASLTIHQTMDDGRGLVVQLCLQSPLLASSAAQGTEGRQELHHSNSFATVSTEKQQMAAGPLTTVCSVPAALAASVASGNMLVPSPSAVAPETSAVLAAAAAAAAAAVPSGSSAEAASGAASPYVAAASTAMAQAARPSGHRTACVERSLPGAECSTLESSRRAPFRELHGQGGRLLVESSSVGCGETILEEMKCTGSHSDAVAGSFSGSLCLHQLDKDNNVDKKKRIILAILMDITRVSQRVQDQTRRGMLCLAEKAAAEDTVPGSSSYITVDDEATRKKMLHIRQQMAVRRNRQRCRTEFRLMPYS